MRSAIIGLLAETSVHYGTGQGTGIIDLPVAREKTTGYPVIFSSGMKGSLRDLARNVFSGNGKEMTEENPLVKSIFGEGDSAGTIMVSDGRLLLLPVRSLTGHFKWVTCPYLLERYIRDRQLVGLPCSFDIPRPESEVAIVANEEPELFLEELIFKTEKVDLEPIIQAISPLISHKSIQERLFEQLVILNDKDFGYFSDFALQINPRNELESNTKASKNLWYEEVLPPDTLLYGLLLNRPGSQEMDTLVKVKSMFEERPYLQIGGNETIGQGWFAVAWLEGGQENNA